MKIIYQNLPVLSFSSGFAVRSKDPDTGETHVFSTSTYLTARQAPVFIKFSSTSNKDKVLLYGCTEKEIAANNFMDKRAYTEWAIMKL